MRGGLVNQKIDEPIQRAMVAAKISNLCVGKPNTANLQNNQTRAQAAELLNVSERSVNTAKKVQKEAPEQSDRQIAKVLGVDHKTVATQRTEAVQCGEIPHTETRTDSTGRQQPATKPKTIYQPPDSEPEQVTESAKKLRQEKAAVRRAE